MENNYRVMIINMNTENPPKNLESFTEYPCIFKLSLY